MDISAVAKLNLSNPFSKARKKDASSPSSHSPADPAAGQESLQQPAQLRPKSSFRISPTVLHSPSIALLAEASRKSPARSSELRDGASPSMRKGFVVHKASKLLSELTVRPQQPAQSGPQVECVAAEARQPQGLPTHRKSGQFAAADDRHEGFFFEKSKRSKAAK